MSSTSVGLQHRPSRTIPATLAALVLLAIAVLTVIVVSARLINGSWPSAVSGLQSWLRALTWGSSTMIAISAVAVVLGLIVFVAAVKPGGLSAATLRPPAQLDIAEVEYVISRRGLAHLAVATADAVDGVEKVSASASARRVHLSVTTASTGVEDIGNRVRDRVTAALHEAGTEPMPRVTVGVRTREL